MNHQTTLVARQARLKRWAEDVKSCQSRPAGMTVDEWCKINNVSKAAYYWRMAELRKEYLKNNPTEQETKEKSLPTTVSRFVEIKPQPLGNNENKAVLNIGNASLEIKEDISDELLVRIIKAVANVK